MTEGTKTTALLAELLLRRKELAGKVAALQTLKDTKVVEIKTVRKPAHEGLDDVVATVPLLSAAEVLEEYDWHARRLRMVDAAIQQTNWATQVAVDPTVLEDFKPREMTRAK